MASGGSYRLQVAWSAGDATLRSVDIGGEAPVDRNSPASLGFLRVGYLGSSLGPAVTATLALADNGSVIGPIDVPLTFVGEQPFRVQLAPVVAPAAAFAVVLSVCPVCYPLDLGSAVRSVALLGGAVAALPQWVRRVDSLAPASYLYVDRAGVPLSGLLIGPTAKPSGAASISVVAGGVFSLEF